MPCGWEGKRRTGHASQTSVVYPPTDSRPKERKRSHGLHSTRGVWHTLPFSVFPDLAVTVPDRELFIRWVALSAFMPAMQFSLAPWSIVVCMFVCSRAYLRNCTI